VKYGSFHARCAAGFSTPLRTWPTIRGRRGRGNSSARGPAWRVGVGDYCVIYDVFDDELVVMVMSRSDSA
jgi:mRNA-degrading endonuclease RelE of RelBE toxin-antitoxin system